MRVRAILAAFVLVAAPATLAPSAAFADGIERPRPPRHRPPRRQPGPDREVVGVTPHHSDEQLRILRDGSRLELMPVR